MYAAAPEGLLTISRETNASLSVLAPQQVLPYRKKI